MSELTVIDIAGGVLIGNLLTVSVVFCLREADKKGDWADVSIWTTAGVVLPLLFAAVTVYLIA